MAGRGASRPTSPASYHMIFSGHPDLPLSLGGGGRDPQHLDLQVKTLASQPTGLDRSPTLPVLLARHLSLMKLCWGPLRHPLHPGVGPTYPRSYRTYR